MNCCENSSQILDIISPWNWISITFRFYCNSVFENGFWLFSRKEAYRSSSTECCMNSALKLHLTRSVDYSTSNIREIVLFKTCSPSEGENWHRFAKAIYFTSIFFIWWILLSFSRADEVLEWEILQYLTEEERKLAESRNTLLLQGDSFSFRSDPLFEFHFSSKSLALSLILVKCWRLQILFPKFGSLVIAMNKSPFALSSFIVMDDSGGWSTHCQLANPIRDGGKFFESKTRNQYACL